MRGVEEKLAAKRKEQEEWAAKDEQLMAEVLELVPEKHKFHAPLLKIFKRKIKRSKKKGGGGNEEGDEGSDFDSDEESDLSDDDDDDSDDDSDDGEEEACPPGCEHALYDKVLELRERRLDHEEAEAQVAEEVAELTKSANRLKQRGDAIKGELAATRADIEAFQTEKQKALNRVAVVVPLRASQLRMLFDPLEGKVADGEGKAAEGEDGREDGEEDGEQDEEKRAAEEERRRQEREEAALRARLRQQLPASLSEGLIFRVPTLRRLRGRTGELQSEIASLRKQFKNLHRDERRLGRERKVFQKEIVEWEERSVELQKLKFGQEIDVDSLDSMETSGAVRDLQSQIAAFEKQQGRAVEKAKRQVRAQRQRLVELTRENTGHLARIADLTERQQTLERELNTGSAQVELGDQGAKLREEADERGRLVQLVKLQAKEVDALKAEISMLRRKGGHVYTPAV